MSINKRKLPKNESEVDAKKSFYISETEHSPLVSKEKSCCSPEKEKDCAEEFEEVESDCDFENYVASLSDDVMDGSQPLPEHNNAHNPICQLPDLVLESIFSCIPAVDMLTTCTLVCQSWNKLIEHDQFMPWKKLYLKVRNHEADAYNHVQSLLAIPDVETNPNNPFSELSANSIVTLIRFMSVWKPVSAEERKKTMAVLQKHQLYDFAMDVMKKRIFDTASQISDNYMCWMLASTILCLSSTSSSLHTLRSCLLRVYSLHAVMDFFYLAAVCSWVMYKQHLLSQELHYRIYCSISLVENATLPVPVSNDQLAEESDLQLTYEQKKITWHRFSCKDLIRILAYAGTGKTTTLASCVRKNEHLKFLYTSFSKAVVDQGKQAFSDYHNVECRTLHSLAYQGMAMNRYPRKLSRFPFRVADIRTKLRLSPDDKQLPPLIIKTMKKFLSSSDTKLDLRHVPSKQRAPSPPHHMEDLEPGRRKEVLKHTRKLYQRTCDLSNNNWQMTDDCYVKQWQLTKPIIDQYDVIMLDEAQDCTDCMKDILLRQNEHCALVLVGDSHQQIYGFRLASDTLLTVPSTHSYYLTQSFRFGNDIALVADTILRVFKFNDFSRNASNRVHPVADRTLLGIGAPGSVCGNVGEGQVATLCRTNLGVIKQVLKTLHDSPSKQVAVVGGAAKLGLELLLDLYALTKPILQRRGKFAIKRKDLQKYRSLKELEKESLLNDDENMISKIEIVKVLADKLPLAVETLKGLPEDIDTADVIVSTVHKAKGLEFETVVLCDDFARALVEKIRCGKTLSRFEQEEANLLYVASTRAKRRLVMSDGLCDLLKCSKVHFLQPKPSVQSPDGVKEESLSHDGAKEECVKCYSHFTTSPPIRMKQPAIEKMQPGGLLCGQCGGLLAPGWSDMLENQSP